jgi:hypothetical protein
MKLLLINYKQTKFVGLRSKRGFFVLGLLPRQRMFMISTFWSRHICRSSHARKGAGLSTALRLPVEKPWKFVRMITPPNSDILYLTIDNVRPTCYNESNNKRKE